MQELTDRIIAEGILHSPRMIDAFMATDRSYFVPESLLDYCYIDVPLPIGENQTISQPSTVAFMLELLEPKEGDRVLDVGSGSGWTTALLCHIVGEKGSVTGVERVDSLVKQGKRNLSQFYSGKHCRIQKAEEKLGLVGKKFDKILVSASANEIPEELLLQLNPGGIAIVPIRDSILKFKKVSETQIDKEVFYGFVFVPLIY